MMLFKRLKIGARIALALGGTLTVAVAATGAGGILVSGNMSDRMLSDQLHDLGDTLAAEVEAEARRATSLADLVAAMPIVQRSMADGDREALAGLFVPGFGHMRDAHGVRQFQFHTAPATSFLRVHMPDRYGDDLSGFRRTVVQVNNEQEIRSGLERGVAGLGMRGVAPVAHEGRNVGSVEFGLSFGEHFFSTFRADTGADVALYLIAGHGRFERFASTFPAAVEFVDETLQSGLDSPAILPRFSNRGTDYAALLMPVEDFGGEVIGIGIVARERSHIDAALAHSRNLSLIIGAAVMAMAMLVAWWMHRGIARPLATMTTIMRRLAADDLAAMVPQPDRQDEIGDMAEALKVFKTNAVERKRLQGAQVDASRAAAERRSAVQAMADKVETETAQAVSAVAGEAQELEDSSVRMTEAMTAMTQEAGSAAAAARQALSNAQTVSTAAGQLASSISEIGRQVAHSNDVATRAVNLAGETREVVQGLAETATQIGRIVDMIGDIAAQTNLLALNATIEAARAGEAGKGFAVVAGEVKNLANQTAKSAAEINDQITAIQNVSQQAGQAIEDVSKTIDEIGSIASDIATAVEQQTAATQDIARNVEETAGASREVTGRMDRVSSGAGDTGEQAERVRLVASMLTQDVRSLQNSLTRIVRTATVDADRRDDERHPLELAARILVGPSVHDAMTIDVSTGGMQLFGGLDLTVGQNLVVEVPETGWRNRACVRSTANHALHLQFEDGGLQMSAILDAVGRSTRAA